MPLHSLCLAASFLFLAPERGAALDPPERQGAAGEDAAEPLYRAAVAASADEPAAVLERLEAALRAGACPTRALIEAAFARLHTLERFRLLIRAHARQSRIVMVLAEEPGEPLEVSGTVREADGTPVANALVYAFQTDASGHYTPDGMDERNPRLFGYLRTDGEGRYALRTIRPGHYPDQDEPVEQHVHLEIAASGRAPRPARLGFADDPFWRAHKGGAVPAWAVPVVRAEDGLQRCTFDVTLPAHPR